MNVGNLLWSWGTELNFNFVFPRHKLAPNINFAGKDTSIKRAWLMYHTIEWIASSCDNASRLSWWYYRVSREMAMWWRNMTHQLGHVCNRSLTSFGTHWFIHQPCQSLNPISIIERDWRDGLRLVLDKHRRVAGGSDSQSGGTEIGSLLSDLISRRQTRFTGTVTSVLAWPVQTQRIH